MDIIIKGYRKNLKLHVQQLSGNGEVYVLIHPDNWCRHLANGLRRCAGKGTLTKNRLVDTEGEVEGMTN